MYYTVYKITNQINGKIYIGMHQTKNLDDGYMGSGTYLKRAKEKYGIENFTKEILFVFDNYEDMVAKEKELVNECFVKESSNYNQVVGGGSGFYWINKFGLNNTNKNKEEIYAKVSSKLKGKAPSDLAFDNLKKAHKEGKIKYDTFSGKKHTEKSKYKISKANKLLTGDLSSQYGTKWITNGSDERKLGAYDKIPIGWWGGRVSIPKFSKLDFCHACKQKEIDTFWMGRFDKSGMSVSQFVREIYPFNRASFYALKNRLKN